MDLQHWQYPERCESEMKCTGKDTRCVERLIRQTRMESQKAKSRLAPNDLMFTTNVSTWIKAS